MPCYSPLHGYICQDGKFRMSPGRDGRPQAVPCGQCVGCRLERSRQWAVRCMHEASLYERNCFVTLTYSPENLPSDSGLHYDDFQKFMKRLRFFFKGHQPVADGTFPIRFYMCGEYGDLRGRPHFHTLLFNFDFDDRVVHGKSPSGKLIYRSARLEELWPYGFSSVGDVTFSSAAYVARYIMKKITGAQAGSVYQWCDPHTGEVFDRNPEFNKMSLKPGIGAGWFDKFSSDVYPHDYVVVNGRKLRPPRFYDKRFERMCLDSGSCVWDEISLDRYITSRNSLDDNTIDRLKVKEQVTLAKLSRLKRKLL